MVGLKKKTRFMRLITTRLHIQTYPKIVWDGDTLTFEIDLVDFDDGWHDIIIFAQSEIGDSTYSHDCISIRIDNTPPSVILDIPEKLPEGTSTVYLDASSTFDEYGEYKD